MRSCHRCNCDMIEDAAIRVDYGGYGITLISNDKIFAKSVGKIRAAVCPKCGEVSLYIKEIDKIEEVFNNGNRKETYEIQD